MKRLRFAALAGLFAFSLSTLSYAAGPARARLDAFAQGLHAISGNFTQTLTDPSGKVQTSNGTMVMEAPRQFRWDTLAPQKQILVADGSRIWLYDPDLEQATVRKQDSEEAHSPLMVLTDLKMLDKDFKVTEQGEHDGLQWLRLTSTGADPQFSYVDLGFDANGLVRMQFKDQLGSVSDIRFSNWQRNPPIPPEDFNFTPPKGTDVVGDQPELTTQPLKN
ncbi:outer membrane lipoprotein chaperone LolA [Dyella mobilis]|uniref:Outer-membrane lipoprotein carrier protein n=1 Tax=Dyella mobilis TaxID=1849582 RepID=A0ABS2KJK1_9GAMM|nr:outer membrane lipoprotein chaperone LolA [Dyella mobilis]MBM7130977.1 outer membrane lipoprotein chaperone LolA [Dyella mobilis]GLQ97606.1 outer-membrane lipoprotein carrier protein [Dyella mobilis]